MPIRKEDVTFVGTEPVDYKLQEQIFKHAEDLGWIVEDHIEKSEYSYWNMFTKGDSRIIIHSVNDLVYYITFEYKGRYRIWQKPFYTYTLGMIYASNFLETDMDSN